MALFFCLVSALITARLIEWAIVAAVKTWHTDLIGSWLWLNQRPLIKYALFGLLLISATLTIILLYR